jgi:hypothetical protein
LSSPTSTAGARPKRSTGSHDAHLWVVAVILAAGLATALNLFCFAVLYEAIFHTRTSGVSENATQILTGWGGGIVGILGAFIGYRAATGSTPPPPPTDDGDGVE